MRRSSVLGVVLSVMCASAALNGCTGVFDGIYDEPVADADLQLGFNDTGQPGRFTILLDARNYDRWLFLDLHRRTVETKLIPTRLTGEWDGQSVWMRYHVAGSRYTLLEECPVDTQEEPAEWDMAIHHFDVRTNGGAAMVTGYASLDDVPDTLDAAMLGAAGLVADSWTRHQCIVDFSGMFDRNIWYQASMVNPVLTEWVTMDLSTPPPKYEASRRVYLLRLADGTMLAMQLRSYMSEAGTKGFLTIDSKWISVR